jgi:hypothetical protein
VAEVSVPEFRTANFTGYVKDLKFNIGGDAILQIVIPYEDREEAKKFVDSRGLLLVISVNRIDYEAE